MAGRKKSVIETGVDKLVNLVNERGSISVKDAAKELGISVANVDEWAEFLEESGVISIRSGFAKTTLVKRDVDNDVLIDSLRNAKEEKQAFLRRIESSMNALQGDSDELKLIDSEFVRIKDILEKNFNVLSKKLDKLEDFKALRHDIERKRSDVEKKYCSRLSELESGLKQEHKKYEDLLHDVDKTTGRLKAEHDRLEALHESEKSLEMKAKEVKKLLDSVRSEIDKESAALDSDDKKLSASKMSAVKLRDEIYKSSEVLKGLAGELVDARKEFQRIEKTFMDDLDRLEKGRLDKVSAFRDGRAAVERFRKFLADTGNVESLIKSAEKEEEELLRKFSSLARKAHGFSFLASSPKVKSELVSLKDDFDNIEVKRRSLLTKLKSLRSMMRSVSKGESAKKAGKK